MITLFDLRCEFRRDPDSVDAVTPRLSWAWAGLPADAWQSRLALADINEKV